MPNILLSGARVELKVLAEFVDRVVCEVHVVVPDVLAVWLGI